MDSCETADTSIEAPQTLVEKLAEWAGEPLMQADGFEDCIIGTAQAMNEPTKLVYSVTKVLEKLAVDMSIDEAREYFDFNMAGAYMGPQTPIWCEDDIRDLT